MNPGIHTKRLIFYWTTSFILATAGYYILRFIMPDHYVFGLLYRMFLYHWEHPVMFILIPCFFYGIIATLLSGSFAKQGMTGQILVYKDGKIRYFMGIGNRMVHHCIINSLQYIRIGHLLLPDQERQPYRLTIAGTIIRSYPAI